MSTIIHQGYNYPRKNIKISIRAMLPLWKAHRLYRNWKLVFHHDCMEIVRYLSFLLLVAVTKYEIVLSNLFWITVNILKRIAFSLLQNNKILLTLGRCLLKDSSLSMSYWVRCPKTLLSKVNTIKVHNRITDPSSLGSLVAIFGRLIQSFS